MIAKVPAYLVHDMKRGGLRFHHRVASDPNDMHDHPWDFASLILHGCYLEHTPQGEHLHRATTVVVHAAEDVHRLELPEGDVWTYVHTGPVRRRWGFWTDSGWVHCRDYLAHASSRVW